VGDFARADDTADAQPAAVQSRWLRCRQRFAVRLDATALASISTVTGAAFAMYEMKIVLAAILATRELTLLEKQPVPPRLRAATVGPKTGIRMVAA
jgi:hypothetical protein